MGKHKAADFVKQKRKKKKKSNQSLFDNMMRHRFLPKSTAKYFAKIFYQSLRAKSKASDIMAVIMEWWVGILKGVYPIKH